MVMIRSASTVALLVFLVAPLSAQPPGGRRGGFDPASFLDRMDRNQNGRLDPDEQNGPIGGLLERLSSFDSSIKPGTPISLDRIKGAFAKMRDGGGSGRDGRGRDDKGRDDRGRDDRGRSDRGRDEQRRYDRERDSEDLSAEMLVPGFGEELLPDLLLGFGPTAEIMATSYSDSDLKEANDRLRQFDKNKNGYVDASEITPIFAGQPMDYDRNRDGRLSATELAIRQARRREAKETRSNEEKRRKEESNRDTPSSGSPVDLYGGRRSYRVLSSRTIEGAPGFFFDKDTDGNQQVTMAEFATEWTDELVREFEDYDFNGDGVITGDEAVRSVEQGKVSEVLAPKNHGSSPGAASTSAAQPVKPRPESSSVGKASQKYVAHARAMVSKYDANGDGAITVSEMKKMLIKPTKADLDRDGKVTTAEYAWYLQQRDQRFRK